MTEESKSSLIEEIKSVKKTFFSCLDIIDALIPNDSSKELIELKKKIKKSILDSGNSFYKNMILLVSIYFGLGREFYDKCRNSGHTNSTGNKRDGSNQK